jgi:hypothetical protein
VGTVGRVGQSVYQLSAHGLGVTDWEFSPFDANVLITGSENGEVWQGQRVQGAPFDHGSQSHQRLLCSSPFLCLHVGLILGNTGQSLGDHWGG